LVNGNFVTPSVLRSLTHGLERLISWGGEMAPSAISKWVGSCVGETESSLEGVLVGPCVGETESSLEGVLVGPCVGETESSLEGVLVGPCVGETESSLEGVLVGPCVGETEGSLEGESLGSGGVATHVLVSSIIPGAAPAKRKLACSFVKHFEWPPQVILSSAVKQLLFLNVKTTLRDFCLALRLVTLLGLVYPVPYSLDMNSVRSSTQGAELVGTLLEFSQRARTSDFCSEVL